MKGLQNKFLSLPVLDTPGLYRNALAKALQNKFISPLVLHTPGHVRKYNPHTDVFVVWVNCIAPQQQEDDTTGQIRYRYCCLSDELWVYDTTNIEWCDAVSVALLLRYYLKGARSTITTDHDSLRVSWNRQMQLAYWPAADTFYLISTPTLSIAQVWRAEFYIIC